VSKTTNEQTCLLLADKTGEEGEETQKLFLETIQNNNGNAIKTFATMKNA